MSYLDLRDFNPEFIWQFDLDDGREVWVEIEKLGGGVVGQTYQGTWRYMVWLDPKRADGTLLIYGQDCESGSEINHLEAAQMAVDWINDHQDGEHSGYPHQPGTLYGCPACVMPS